jgi:hypothetical protein
MHLAVQKHASSCSKACIHETSERSHYVNRGSWPAEGSTLIYLQSPKGTHNEQNDISLTWCMVMCDPFGVDALRDIHTPRVKTRGYLCVTSSRSFYIENRSTKNKTRFILYCSHLFVPLTSGLRYFRLEMKKKSSFSFCISLAYSYLCTRFQTFELLNAAK